MQRLIIQSPPPNHIPVLPLQSKSQQGSTISWVPFPTAPNCITAPQPIPNPPNPLFLTAASSLPLVAALTPATTGASTSESPLPSGYRHHPTDVHFFQLTDGRPCFLEAVSVRGLLAHYGGTGQSATDWLYCPGTKKK